MMSLTEKLAYIKGLCEGLELEPTTKEGKVLLALVDLLDDVTDTVSQLDSDIEQIFDEIDAIDEDLSDVEDALLFDDEDEDEFDFDDEDEDDEEWDDENPIYEITCPNCSEVVCMDEDLLFSPDCACPNCGTKFEVDFDEEECACGDDCGCGDDCDCK